jgi:hypothetical protein
MGRPQNQVRKIEVNVVKRPSDSAAEDDVVETEKTATQTAGTGSPGTNSVTIWTNNSGSTRFLEAIYWAVEAGYFDDVLAVVQVRDDNDDVVQEFVGNPGQFPVPLEIPVRVKDGWDVHSTVENRSGSAVDYVHSITHRGDI